MATGVAQCPFAFTNTGYALPTGQWDITSADFNADGHIDLATANSNTNCISVLYNNNNGTFTTITTFSASGLSPFRIKVADFNGDGKPDLAVLNNPSNANTLSVMLNNGSGSFTTTNNYTVNAGTRALFLADFNSDNNIDIATTSTTGIQVLLGTGAGSFSTSVQNMLSNIAYPDMDGGDFNSDGKMDLAIADGYNNVYILLGSGAATFTSMTTVATPTANYRVRCADFNSDGKLDIGISCLQMSSGLLIYLGTGSGGFTNSGFILGQANDIAAGDFDGDGKQEIVDGQSYGTVVYFCSYTATPFVVTNHWNTYGGFPTAIVVNDFNHDNFPDIATTGNLISGNLTVYLNTYSAVPHVSISPSASLICTGESVILTAMGANTYSWSTQDTASSISVSPSVTTSYTVNGTTNNCLGTAKFTINVQSCNGIPDVTRNLEEISLYPNPASGDLHINSITAFHNRVVLLNIVGQKVIEVTCPLQKETSVDVSGLMPGIYFAEIFNGSMHLAQKKLMIH